MGIRTKEYLGEILNINGDKYLKYNFDKLTDRRGTGSYKWDVKEGELPMWVADMDFETAPEIIEAFEERVHHGIFGYGIVPDEWYEAYQNWWQRRYHFTMEKEWLIFCTGVVPAISSIVRKLTTPNENVLIQTPVYNIFFNSIINNGCRVLENQLIYNPAEMNHAITRNEKKENGLTLDGSSNAKRIEQDEYEIDFEDFEQKLANPQTTLMILCNPHNPVGKIWDKETLARIGHLCAIHNVTVISDEIHCDLVAPGKSYIPFASVSEECKNISITCIAPTKAFNLAGLQTAAVSIPNPLLRHKVWRGLNTDEVAEPNAFAVTAVVAAFNKGEAWLTELNEYIAENKKCVTEFIEKNISAIRVIKGEATYLMWLDCTEICKAKNIDSVELANQIRERTGLYFSDGLEYGEPGKYFLRMNVACPRDRVMDGLNRLNIALS